MPRREMAFQKGRYSIWKHHIKTNIFLVHGVRQLTTAFLARLGFCSVTQICTFTGTTRHYTFTDVTRFYSFTKSFDNWHYEFWINVQDEIRYKHFGTTDLELKSRTDPAQKSTDLGYKSRRNLWPKHFAMRILNFWITKTPCQTLCHNNSWIKVWETPVKQDLEVMNFGNNKLTSKVF